MQFFLIFIGYALGINFPDIDHKIKFLGHRSFLTHSPIVTFVIYYFARQKNMKELNYILIGFSFAIAVHLIFDFFPKAWTGGSIIKPFGGVLFSKFYILCSVVISVLFSLRVAKSLETYIIMSLIGIIGIFIYSKKERTLVRPIILYFVIVVFLGNIFYLDFINQVIKLFQGFINEIKL